MWLDQHDYVNKASGKFENLLLRRSYIEVYTVLFFTDMFKQSIIHYIDEYLMELFLTFITRLKR